MLQDLDDVATYAYNAVQLNKSQAYDPIDGWADIEEDGFEQPKYDWKLIKSALELMPVEALEALCRFRGLSAPQD